MSLQIEALNGLENFHSFQARMLGFCVALAMESHLYLVTSLYSSVPPLKLSVNLPV